MWEYTDKAEEHFLSPGNAGEVEDAQGVAEVGAMSYGKGKITGAGFKTFGGAPAPLPRHRHSPK